jgi:RNA polymerase sigma-70 factor (ECF subfamily)
MMTLRGSGTSATVFDGHAGEKISGDRASGAIYSRNRRRAKECNRASRPEHKAAMTDAGRTTVIQGWVDRLQNGDDSARAALLECANERLGRLARKMIRGYPGVARWEQAEDVLQNALIRLDRALQAAAPPTALDFYRLAAALLRRELIDLARHYSGSEGQGAHHATWAGSGQDPEISETTWSPDTLAQWTEFHRQVEALEDDDRALFDLLWYQGLTQAEAAAALGVAEKTVNRRWVAARLRLSDALGGRIPT